MARVGKTTTSHFQRAGYIGKSMDALCLLSISSPLSSPLQPVSPHPSLTAPYSPSSISQEAEPVCGVSQTPCYLLCLVLCSATQAALLRCLETATGTAVISITTKRRWEGDGTRSCLPPPRELPHVLAKAQCKRWHFPSALVVKVCGFG